MSVAFPGPSDNLRTHGVLSDSLQLTWNAPASAVPVLGYQVSAQAGGTSGFSVVVVDTGSAATQAHVTGLNSGCWCASLRAHPHAPARAPPVPGAKPAFRCRVHTPLSPRCTYTNRYEFRVAARTEGGLGAMSAPSPPVQMARSAGAARSIPPSSPFAPAPVRPPVGPPVRPLMKGGTGVGAGVHGRARAEARAPPSPLPLTRPHRPNRRAERTSRSRSQQLRAGSRAGARVLGGEGGGAPVGANLRVQEWAATHRARARRVANVPREAASVQRASKAAATDGRREHGRCAVAAAAARAA